MTWIVRGAIALGIVVLLLLGLAYGPGALQAQRFEPVPLDPELDAMFTDPLEPLAREGDFFGAEDLEPGPDGRLYTSLADGRILARAPEGGWEEFAHTGGRPLGLAFGPDGALFVADALKGLLKRTQTGWQTWLADESEGGPLVFTDDLTVLADGSVILTDASRRYGYGEYMTSFLEGEQTGVVYRVTAPGEYTVLMEGRAFINGVDHDPATGLVYVNETWAGQVWELDPASGEHRVIIDGLPGYPDNLEFDAGRGLIWIALPSRRSPELEPLHPRPFVKRLAWRWIQVAGLPELPPRPVMGLAITPEGEPVHALLGPDDQDFGITTILPWQGALWVAGLEREGVETYPLPGGRER
ncbi:SMP-30/gluconolactonase/LRE family protein [Marinicauda algicola]|uniref:SMP-30/gluconolactonase/LRE family protein n=1 Tax=Marinicauda algicola TaxID=2029849 RepID=A0A4S2H4U0_9PROT|nr:SMP-30/gluconolactonase/LRE family protein [Marinicauda algicola]TGY90431.1 SMP-30/gluconolactonase/LRE family protein [Marinicauda algicola]